jgi:hypothetical protein
VKKKHAVMYATILFAIALVIALATLAAPLAQAQETMMAPPKVLVLTREVVKPGKTAEHEQWETGWPAAYSKANWPVHYLAMSSMTGENRALFLSGYDSLEAWNADGMAQEKNAALSASQKMLYAKDGDFLTKSETAVFLYQPELSYKPEAPVKGTHYFMISAVQVKPGHGRHFEEIRKLVRAAHEKANVDEHFAVFAAALGRPDGYYLIFYPMQSPAEIDKEEMTHGKGYRDAVGEEGMKKIMEFRGQGVESSENQLFVLSPKMSYAYKEWIAADPDFWGPKHAMPMKGMSMKKEAKPDAAKP